MSIPAAWPQVLDFFGTPFVIEPLPGQLTSHAGLPPVRPFDQRSGRTHAFTDPLDDPRDTGLIAHGFREMVRSREFAGDALALKRRKYKDPGDLHAGENDFQAAWQGVVAPGP